MHSWPFHRRLNKSTLIGRVQVHLQWHNAACQFAECLLKYDQESDMNTNTAQ